MAFRVERKLIDDEYEEFSFVYEGKKKAYQYTPFNPEKINLESSKWEVDHGNFVLIWDDYFFLFRIDLCHCDGGVSEYIIDRTPANWESFKEAVKKWNEFPFHENF